MAIQVQGNFWLVFIRFLTPTAQKFERMPKGEFIPFSKKLGFRFRFFFYEQLDENETTAYNSKLEK